MVLVPRIVLVGFALALAACTDTPAPNVTPTPPTPREGPPVTREAGSLASGDVTLTNGEYIDTYDVVAREGQWLRVELLSSDFDPFLIIESPTGVQTQVDDSEQGNQSYTKAIVEATESGAWTIGVTTFEPGESGAYSVSYNVLDSRPPDADEGRQVETTAAN